jgi:hypothetical protein
LGPAKHDSGTFHQVPNLPRFSDRCLWHDDHQTRQNLVGRAASSPRANDPVYLKLLLTSSRSLSQWIGCTFLAWGILVSTTLYEVSRGMMNEKVTGRLIILSEIRELSTALSMALLVALFVFLVRWHVLARIDGLPD